MSMQKAILAGGCFWGMEELLRGLPGVVDTQVGYTGGHFPNPRYEDVCRKDTGHAEAVAVMFDDTVLSYRWLLEYFFQIHDPTTLGRQGNDIGASYRSAIFYGDDTQHETAKRLIAEINASGKWPDVIVTELNPASMFYAAEEYHQDYLQKNPNGYTCHFIRPHWRI